MPHPANAKFSRKIFNFPCKTSDNRKQNTNKDVLQGVFLLFYANFASVNTKKTFTTKKRYTKQKKYE